MGLYDGRKRRLIWLGIIFMTAVLLPPCDASASDGASASGGTKIHFISLYSTTDAILLESNGHYGMVDSGEDWDYPDGEEYPLRQGVTQGIGYEQQVIHYLEQLGVERLDFYIATHAHSDHIGSGDEILKHFPTDRLYINEYKDEYMVSAHGTDPEDPYYVEGADESGLWDNQYVYDCLIEAAKEQGTEIITNLDDPASAGQLSFAMEDMQIEIMNADRERDSEGNIIPVPGENCNSLVTKVTAFGRTALLTSDLDPWAGGTAEYSDTVKVAHQLIDQLWTEEDAERENLADVQVDIGEYETAVYEEYNGVTLSAPPNEEEQQAEETQPSIDESGVNTGRTISLDLMKMCHHSVDYNNTTYFLTSLNPKTVVITGPERFYNARERAYLPDAETYITMSSSAAVVATFTEDGIVTEYTKMEPGWQEIDGRLYYFDENGRTYGDGGSHVIDGVEYCFDKKGAVETSSRWVKTGNVWKYWKEEGCFAASEWIETDGNTYYCDGAGKMVTGWQRIEGAYYYFASSGRQLKDQWIKGHYVDEDGVWVSGYSTAKWISSGGRWWYRYGNGGYPADQWENIDGARYYFDASGWMATGWRKIQGKWYYFNQSGHMLTNTWVGNCYVDSFGVWNEEPAVDRWIQSGGRWWYRHADGSYTVSAWEYIDNCWYYFDASGWRTTGWKKIQGDWYYFNSDGVMAADTWIGSYYVDASGAWDTSRTCSRWISSGGCWWYRHEDGSYTKSGWEWIDGARYYFDASGWMVTGWQFIEDKWYYMYKNGAMAANAWVGNYYLKADGTMARSEWVDGGKYYVDETGLWVQK